MIGRLARGRAEIRCGRRWSAGPGSLHVARVGDTHTVTPLGGPLLVTVVAFSDWAPPVPLQRHFEPGDPRAAEAHRVLDAAWSDASPLALDVALAELTDAMGALRGRSHYGQSVDRAIEVIRDDVGAAIRLEALAAHAGVSRFRLCREFRARLGISPYAYVTRLRVGRAKILLARGVPATEVAAAVGFYDQSQLNRHFRRLVGTTPGRFARRSHGGGGTEPRRAPGVLGGDGDAA